MAKKIDTTESVKLSELIEIIRHDLLESHEAQTADTNPLFKISGATVEVELEVKRESKAEGKVNLYVTTLGAGGTETTGQKCKMKIDLLGLDDEALYFGVETE